MRPTTTVPTTARTTTEFLNGARIVDQALTRAAPALSQRPGGRPPCDCDDPADVDRLVSELVDDANELDAEAAPSPLEDGSISGLFSEPGRVCAISLLVRPSAIRPERGSVSCVRTATTTDRVSTFWGSRRPSTSSWLAAKATHSPSTALNPRRAGPAVRATTPSSAQRRRWRRRGPPRRSGS